MTTETFTVFSEERRALIAKMKQTVKARNYKGGLTHAHFVLYAALRGQDIRKTSHLPDGDNARDVIEKFEKIMSRYTKWNNVYPLNRIKYEDGNSFFTPEDNQFLKELFAEIKQKLEVPMKQAS